MTNLFITTHTMPSASMGEDNPLPDLQKNADTHVNIQIDESAVSPEESRYMGWGRVNGALPYTLRDGYDRDKKPREWKAAVLQNDFLKATFLPELGGRLWSLIDRVTGRELLHRNPVFQPCNLAIRNAWISGGVEWNVGVIGHTPFTVDPLFAESLTMDDGTPVLRMYQYERIRHLVYRIEALLPENSRQLLVQITVDNAGDSDTAVYWWSNIAVDEREDIRILVPACRAYRYGYGGKLTKVPVPRLDAMDASRPMSIPQSMDFFFDIEDGRRRFIAALDADGYGLFQTSTDVLRGRKLFVWGMGAGGRNWQSFLSKPGSAYVEIQAGLARTQLEHIPMKGGSRYQWTEAYGALRADSASIHDEDWHSAVSCAEAALEASLPRTSLETWERTISIQLEGRHGELFHMGDGWGALEQRLCGSAFRGMGLRFPEHSAGSAEREWLALLTDGALPCADPLALPGGYQVNDRWMTLLKASIVSGKGDHWYANFHMGVMYAYRNQVADALQAFERSIAQARSPWALRCVAVLLFQSDEKEKAADLMLEAVMMKQQRHLALEALRILSEAGRYADIERVAAALPEPIQKLGRLKTILADALLELGRLTEAERLLLGDFEMADVREGEVKLTDLWFKLCDLKGVSHEENPPPKHLDFRMR